MILSDQQKKWLKAVTAQDLARAYIKQGWDYKYYKEIEREWLEIHSEKRTQTKLAEKWGNPETWV
jgi:hypothetical protein